MESFNNILESFYNAFFVDHRYMAYLGGLKVTILISVFSILIGVLIGIIVAITKVSSASYRGSKIIKSILRICETICDFYITIIRGTPVILQLLIIYNLIFTSRNTNEIFVGAICFGINSGAYVAEIFRAGIESVDKGQAEAGRSLGFTYLSTMIFIVVPQAIKNILPALGNEFIVLIKETSVASVIAVTDLTKAAQYIGSRTWDVLPPLIIAAVFYLLLLLIMTNILKVFERRLKQSDSH